MALAFVGAAPLGAQTPNLAEGLRVARLQAEPAQITVEAGKSSPLKVVALDAQGQVVHAVIRAGARRGTVQVG